MKHLHEKRILKYSIQELFDLVIDIESYPKFLPWVGDAVIISHEPGKIIADLSVHFGGFKQTYRSNVTYENDGEKAFVEAESHTGPFKHLKTRWEFQKITNATHVDFTLEFELKSKLMTNLVGPVIIEAQRQMIEAFEKRLKEKYGNKA